MKKTIVLFFIFSFSFFIHCSAQIISTFAGNGIGSYSGDGGPAIDAELYFPATVVFNKSGNMYVSEGNRVEMITMSSEIINRFAGGGSHLGFANGIPDTDAQFSITGFIALDDSGNVYIPDIP